MSDIDYSQYFDESGLKSPFYRVSLKAVVRDTEGRVLVAGDANGTYELPGGGWEHDESMETALRREIEEELGVKIAEVGDVLFVYRGTEFNDGIRSPRMRIAVEAELDSYDFAFAGDEVSEARFVDREEFLRLNWSDAERGIIECADRLWPRTGAIPSSTTSHDAISL